MDHLAALVLLVIGAVGGATLLLLGVQMAIGSKAWVGVGYAAGFGGLVIVALLAGFGPSLAGPLTTLQAAIAILVLFGVFVNLAIGALGGSRQLVTSFSMQEEQMFQPFERAGSSSSARAWVWGIAVSALFFVFMVGVFFGVQPESKDITKDMNMSNLSKKTHASDPAPTPTPAPADTK